MKRSALLCGLALTTCISMLVACTRSTHPAATQVAAKVNGGEITVHQVNSMLAQIPNVTSDTSKAVSASMLERLIDQELLVQKAQAAKLDRNPQVLQAIEAARRSALASAFVQQIVGSVSKPTDAEIHDYFVQHPEFFTARRVYIYRSIAIRATADEVVNIQKQLITAKNVDAVLDYLRANKLPYIVNMASKATEQLPLEVVPRFAALREGDLTTFPASGGLDLVQIVSSKEEPVDEGQGRPFIEKFLMDRHRDELIAAQIKSLRSAATIEYVGDFKAPAAKAATSPPPKNDVVTGIAQGIK